MKLDIQAFNLVVSNPVYEGYDTYLLTDDKEKIDYHINMFIVESGNVCAMICQKTKGDDNFEMYEFNGNKLLEHKIVRLKEVSKDSVKFTKFIEKYKNHEFEFQKK